MQGTMVKQDEITRKCASPIKATGSTKSRRRQSLWTALERTPLWPSSANPLRLPVEFMSVGAGCLRLATTFTRGGLSRTGSGSTFVRERMWSYPSNTSSDSFVNSAVVEAEWAPLEHEHRRGEGVEEYREQCCVAEELAHRREQRRRSSKQGAGREAPWYSKGRIMQSSEVERLSYLSSSSSCDTSLSLSEFAQQGGDLSQHVCKRNELWGVFAVGNMNLDCEDYTRGPAGKWHTSESSEGITSTISRPGNSSFFRQMRRSNSAYLSEPDHQRSLLRKMIFDPALAHLCDVTLIVRGERFPAHKAVLAASSPVLQAMFTNGMREKGLDEIELKGMDPRSWQIALEYIYTARARIEDIDTAFLALASARMYNLARLEDFIENYLIANLTAENCLDLLDLAELYTLTELTNACFKKMQKNFEELSDTKTFLDCPAELLTRLLKSNDLLVKSELTVFHAVMRWISACRSRTRFLDQMIKLVHFHEMSESELAHVCRNPTAMGSEDLKMVVIKLFLHHRQRNIDLGGLGEMMTALKIKARKRCEPPFTFWHEICDIHLQDEPEVRTPWKADGKGKYMWRLKVYPNGYGENSGRSFSMYLQIGTRLKNDVYDFHANFELYLVNRNQQEDTVVLSTKHHFLPHADHWGFHRVIALKDLNDPDKGYVDKKTNSIIVGGSVTVITEESTVEAPA